MKVRIAGLALPLLLLLPGATAAQSNQSCTIDVNRFDAGYDACVVAGFPDDPSRAAALKAAQSRWDSFAKQMGTAAATLWLGPRPKTVADIWWLPSQ